MAIPTLRRLGLIVGYEDLIRLSANGALVRLAKHKSKDEGVRALRAVQYEMDVHGTGFVQKLAESPAYKEDFIKSVTRTLVFVDKSGKVLSGTSLLERVNDWLNFLLHSQLIDGEGEYLRVSPRILEQVQNDVTAQLKESFFRENLLPIYQSVVQTHYGVGTIEIEELRRAIAQRAYGTVEAILTERQFDELLRQMPKATGEYIIAFGRPMGKDEKLFKLGDDYYQTISIRRNI
jgi:hypothetical protein